MRGWFSNRSDPFHRPSFCSLPACLIAGPISALSWNAFSLPFGRSDRACRGFDCGDERNLRLKFRFGCTCSLAGLLPWWRWWERSFLPRAAMSRQGVNRFCTIWSAATSCNIGPLVALGDDMATGEGASQALWALHKKRMAEMVRKLGVGGPNARLQVAIHLQPV